VVIASGHNVYAKLAAAMLKAARLRRPPVRRFAQELCVALGCETITRQTIYSWESGRCRVPAAVILTAAAVSGTSLDELISLSGRYLAKRDDAEEHAHASLTTPC
jgi:transcriptional regulator with XRE-family HTH domain